MRGCPLSRVSPKAAGVQNENGPSIVVFLPGTDVLSSSEGLWNTLLEEAKRRFCLGSQRVLRSSRGDIWLPAVNPAN